MAEMEEIINSISVNTNRAVCRGIIHGNWFLGFTLHSFRLRSRGEKARESEGKRGLGWIAGGKGNRGTRDEGNLRGNIDREDALGDDTTTSGKGGG